LVVATGLAKVYPRGREPVRALDSVSFEIRRGEFVAIVGPSGSGKTTVLNLLGCMDAPSSGTLRIGGREVQQFTEKERTRFRREQIGFVFQHFGLLPTLSVAENVALPLLFSRRSADRELDELLERVGLQHRRNHRPGELSGGEMQRAAIARALIHRPSLLLADEPTGNLDSATGESIISLFNELHAGGLTIIVVTHNARLAAAAQRQFCLLDGRMTPGEDMERRRQSAAKTSAGSAGPVF
jgi:putative ABC transport system ATP-binding protein